MDKYSMQSDVYLQSPYFADGSRFWQDSEILFGLQSCFQLSTILLAPLAFRYFTF